MFDKHRWPYPEGSTFVLEGAAHTSAGNPGRPEDLSYEAAVWIFRQVWTAIQQNNLDIAEDLERRGLLK